MELKERQVTEPLYAEHPHRNDRMAQNFLLICFGLDQAGTQSRQ